MTSRTLIGLLFIGAFASVASAQPGGEHGGAAPVTTAASPTTAPVITPVATVATQTVTTPFVGTFALSGAVKGELTIGRRGDTLRFSGDAAGLAFDASADIGDGDTWRLPLGAGATGVVDVVGGHGSAGANPSARVLVVKDAGQGELKVSVEFKGKTSRVAATRKKEALVLYGTYQNAMKVFAEQSAAYYRSRGYAVTLQPGDWRTAVDTLVSAEEDGHPFSRVVVVSHGGWDGPMFATGPHTQVSSVLNDVAYGNLCRAVMRGTTLDARLIFSSCHSGGSNRYETYRTDFRYTDILAQRTGRTAVGVNGSTSTEWSKLLCMFAEGEGPARQESRVSTPGGSRTVMPGKARGSVANLPLSP